MKILPSKFSLPILMSVLCCVLFSKCGNDDDTGAENKSPSISNILPVSSVISDLSTITLSADVTDEDGTISKVEFLIDNEVVGQATTPPYTFDWTPETSEHFTLKVRATDNMGSIETSDDVKLTVVGISCSGNNACSNFSAKDFDHVVTAFYPSWKVSTMAIGSIPWNSLTHIIYSFALPVADGEINTTEIDSNIDALVNAAHAQGVKVYFSIGGAGGSDPFIDLAKDEHNRALFVDRVRCYIKDHCLDGVDIDWEHWTGEANIVDAESNGLVNLLADLREALPEDVEISVDVYASNWFGKHYKDEVHQHVNYVHTMLYDLRGSWSEPGPHSKYEEVIYNPNAVSIESWGLMYWNGYRNWPVEKTVVGMPFYGKDFDVNNGDGVDYRTIVSRVIAAQADINEDKFNNTYYDGPITVKRKAAFARDNGYAGVMFWELTGDSPDQEFSLVKAIDEELND